MCKQMVIQRGLKPGKRHEQGAALIIVIMVLTFMLGVGMTLLTVTRTGTEVASNMRYYQEAFNAAEAGFDAAWLALEDVFIAGGGNFDGMYLTVPTGIDDPDAYDNQGLANYFRRKTDEELLETFEDQGIDQTTTGMLFYKQTYINDVDGNPDLRFTYTVFLIDDEAGLTGVDPSDVLLICIGVASFRGEMTTSRIEVELALTTEN